ncbi:MAG TPA: hypothetical protein VIM63_19730 [Rhodoferax sp.]
MPDDKDKPFWKTVLKLTLGAIALIIFVGVGIYLSAKYNTYAPPETAPAVDWGIVTDSPIHSRH